MKTLTPATIAGRYAVSARIGGGGMGEVLRARDQVLGRTVAIKVLPSHLAADPGFVERFRSEAQAAARISHPNVVHVHDWGEAEDTYYMVMEYVRGRNLRELLARFGQLHPRHASDIVAQVLSALEAAHGQNLVHRDVKPENIILGIDGVVKVTDFGIARLNESAPLTDNIFGTVAYVAPEQARGDDVDGRSDLYSVGCLLYELLTGARPFEGDPAAVLSQHLSSRVGSPDIHPPLDRVVLKATSPNPSDRYVDAGTMRVDLMQATEDLEDPGPLRGLTDELTAEVSAHALETALNGPKRKRRWWKWTLLLVVLAAIGAAAYLFRPMKVPQVAGSTQRSAAAELKEAGFGVEIKRGFSSDVSPGRVISVDPAEGTRLLRGSRVTLLVSLGPELTDLRDLTGMDVEVAKRAIEESGLTVGSIELRHDVKPKGTVVAQTPAPGRARKGEPVNLVVSKGPEMIKVPDVKTRLVSEVQAGLEQSGFKIIKEEVFSEAAVGTVLEQSLAAGTEVAKGSEMKLTVSKGPAPFEMPDVKGKSCSDAKAQLQSAGLKVVVLNNRGTAVECGANKVLEQDPLPGSTVKKGQEATLYVA